MKKSVKILDGKALAFKLENKLKEKINLLTKKIKLVVINIGEDKAKFSYINAKKRVCERLGIDFELLHYENDVEENILESLITNLNNDDSVSGIIIQLPIPKHLNSAKLCNLVNINKDIDGLSAYNMGALMLNIDSFKPCTAKGIIKLLDEYNIPLISKNVLIINRSNIVGKPLSAMLINRSASVEICNSYTKDIESKIKRADIIVSATGIKHFIKKENIRAGQVLIDVGITRENNKLYGDFDFENIVENIDKIYISPVPGGIGPLTVICLMENLYEAYMKGRK